MCVLKVEVIRAVTAPDAIQFNLSAIKPDEFIAPAMKRA